MGARCKRIRKEIFVIVVFWSAISTLMAQQSDSVAHQTNANDTITPRTIFFHYQENDSRIPIFQPVERHTGAVHLLDHSLVSGTGIVQSLSTQGSPQQPLHRSSSHLLQPRFLFNPFQGYDYTAENARFYQVNHPYTDLSYFGGTQSTNGVRAIHSQNLLNRWNAALDFKAFLSDGQLHRSEIGKQSLNATTNYSSTTGRYRVLGSYIYNRIRSHENGGLWSDSLFTNNIIANPKALPVKLSSAENLWRNHLFFYQQQLNLNHYDTAKPRPSPFNKGVLSHYASFEHRKKIYSDFSLADSVYAHNLYSNDKTYDSIAYLLFSNSVQWSNDAFDSAFYLNPINISFGAKHTFYQFRDLSTSYSGNRWQPFAVLSLRSARSSITVKGESLSSDKNHHAEHHIAVAANLSKWSFLQQIHASLDWRSENPVFFLNHFHGNHFEWDNSLPNTKTLALDCFVEPINGVLFGGKYYRISHASFLNEQLRPVTHAHSEQMLLGYLQHQFKAGRFSFSGYAQVQKSSDTDVFRLPTFAAKQTMGFHFRLFKNKMNTTVGVDLYYVSKYFADAYDPALGAFYRQNSERIGNYVYSDFFMEAEVQEVSFFFKIRHPYAGVFGRDYFFTPHYPHENLSLRWGVSWQFQD